jgi:Gpi18-like mannosyltransferase
LRRLLPLALVLLALAVRVVPAALFGTEAADLATYHDMALTVSRGDDVYSRSVYFPYTPHSQFLPALAMAFAERTGVPFAFAMRLESILADAATTWLLFAGLLAEGASRRRAALAALGFALNPVAILVSAFHGNLMSLVAFLLLAALVTARASVRAGDGADGAALRASSALLLGLAIAMRSFPVLLLPFLLVLAARTPKRAVVYTALASAASVTSTVPYLLFDRTPFLREVMAYSGAGDFGWFAALRWSAVWKGYDLPAIWTMLPATKPLFLLAYVLALATHLALRRDPSRGLLLAPLLFYAVYGGVASQYLVWVVPLATFLLEGFLLPYTVVATATLVAFYWKAHPSILFGRLASGFPMPFVVGRLLVLANVAFVLVSWAWIVAILAKRSAAREPLGRARLLSVAAIAAGALVWLVLAVSVVKRVLA